MKNTENPKYTFRKTGSASYHCWIIENIQNILDIGSFDAVTRGVVDVVGAVSACIGLCIEKEKEGLVKGGNFTF